MNGCTCRKIKRLGSFLNIGIFLIAIFLVFCFTSSAICGEPVGDVYFYNVDVGTFAVVWEVDVASDYCDVLVYSDNLANPTLVAGYTTSSWHGSTDPTIAQERGVMQVLVENLTEPRKYYVQTRSRESGSSTNIDYPPFTQLLEVTTEPSPPDPVPGNGILKLALYESEIIPGFPLTNLLGDGVVAIVEAGGNYPVSSTNYGFPTSNAVEILFNILRLGGTYFKWTEAPLQDHAITIRCFGGQAPNGVGQRMLDTVFPWELIGTTLGCVSPYADTPLLCLNNNANQIALFKNQPPVLVMPVRDYNDPLDPSIPAYIAVPTLSIQVCAYDPEDDPNITFSLEGEPSNVGLEADADANCIRITGSPAGGFHRNIQIKVSDGTGESSETFTIIAPNGPPLTPTISSPVSAATAVTDDTLTCTIDSNTLVNPDPGDTIYLDYRWYDASETPAALVDEDLNSTSFTSQLLPVNTEKGGIYYCEVIALDDDGSSAPTESAQITVVNSPPSQPGMIGITPVSPTTDDKLTCTISAADDPDPGDNINLVYTYEWSCGACGKDAVIHYDTNQLTDDLSSGSTLRGETWTCKVTAKDPDGAVSDPPVESAGVDIQNLPPTDPGGIHIDPASGVKTGADLTCTIDTNSNEPDGDNVYYVFTWKCTGACGDPNVIVRTEKIDRYDTLTHDNTAKDQTWSCEVWAEDDFGKESNTIPAANTVTILNSPPESLTEHWVEVTPDPAYNANDLTCIASGISDDDGDTISYKYVWEKDGNEVVALRKNFTENKTTDTITADNTHQGETWSCEVTAKDTSNAEVGPDSDQVLIENRPPVITTNPDYALHIWDEEQTYTIQVLVSDPDPGDTWTLEIDTNYVDPDDPNVSEWLSFDTGTNTLTATPPFGSSAIDLGYGGSGMLEIHFIAEDDGNPPEKDVEPVSIMIRFPAITVDDFEYDSNAPTLAENGWFELHPDSGSMSLKQEDPNDPNSNHYLKTTVSGTLTSQLDYTVYKTIPTVSPNDPNTKYDDEYPIILFSVKDTDLYYFDVFVRGINNAGDQENYFLRYIPRDPNVEGWETKKSGRYVSVNVGDESIDPNGNIDPNSSVEIERNMEVDLFKETGFHYLNLKGVVLRGDINFIDDIKVRSAPPRGLPKDVVDLDAIGNENEVTLQWTLPGDQVDYILGYNIYMDTNSPPPKEGAFRVTTEIPTVLPNITSYTKKLLTNDVTYCFRVTAVDNLLHESEGVTRCATPEVNPPLAPVDVMASSIDSTIQLTWKNPSGQHPDLDGYKIYYCDCDFVDCNTCYAAPLVTPGKADPSTGRFTQYITKDENQEFLQYNTTYDFTVKAKDKAGNFSGGVRVSITLRYPATKLIDNFDMGYEPGQSLMSKGWYRLQGKGRFARETEDDVNHYLEVKSSYTGTSALGYNVVKWLTNPADFINPNFTAHIRSMGNFEIILYLKADDGKNYFLSYKGDVSTDVDSETATEVSKRKYVYKLGWMNKASSTEWYDIERNLDDDLSKAKESAGGFDMLLGVVLSGTLDIDDMGLGEGILEVVNLTARPGDQSVLLSWTIADPNKIDETRIYVDGNVDENIVTDPNENDYQHEVTGLTNGTLYGFKVTQVAEGDESNGVSITATPMQYKATFTFDDQTALDEWPRVITEGVALNVVYDSGVQSNVMYLNPNSNYPDRYYVVNENIDTNDVTGMTCRIKTSSNFVIWVKLWDTSGVPTPFMLGFVPGPAGSVGGHYSFGNFGYYFLEPSLTDGNWHLLDLRLDEVMNSIFTGVGTDRIIGIYFGGRIYVDDVSVY